MSLVTPEDSLSLQYWCEIIETLREVSKGWPPTARTEQIDFPERSKRPEEWESELVSVALSILSVLLPLAQVDTLQMPPVLGGERKSG